MKKQFVSFALLSLFLIIFSTTCQRKSSEDISKITQKDEQLLLSLEKPESQMKIRDVIILVKYAQGLVVFNSFLEYVQHMKDDERRKFLSQTVELINKLNPQDSDVIAATKKSELSSDSKQLEFLLNEGVLTHQLGKLLEFEDEDLQGTLKLLLQLFTEVYKRAYETNGNNKAEFWYWDYSNPATAFRVVELDTRQTIDIKNF